MPKTFMMSEVQMIIRKKLKIEKDQSLFLLVNNGKDIVKANEDLETVYSKYRDTDGFLYVFYTEEKVFG